MFAADTPPAVQASQADDQSDVIEVVASRPGQTLKIDRRTYSVKQNPHSAQKNAIQLMRGLPAVTVTPDDQIMLLGNPSVRIFVDGRPYAGDAMQYLRTLHGADIDRIEIITNPSAQYAAEGTAGIINIVLRRRPGDGVSGTISAEIATPARAQANEGVRLKQGKWTYELDAQAGAGRNSESTYRKLRTVRSATGRTPTINTETGGGPFDAVTGFAAAKVTYEPNPKKSVSARVSAGASRNVGKNEAEFTGLTADFESFRQRQRIVSTDPFFTAELAYNEKGAKEGETLKAGAQLFVTPDQRHLSRSDFSDVGFISILRRNKTLFGGAQIDTEYPTGKGEILSAGSSFSLSQTEQLYQFTSADGEGPLGPSLSDRYSARTGTIAAYATFQKTFGKLTAMPGLRLEHNRRHITSPGLPDVNIRRSNIFPTLHLARPLSQRVQLTMSYSKRVDRANVESLRPYPVVEGVLAIFQGNPRLKDQMTDAYELNVHYRRKKIEAGAIIYNRETEDMWSTSYSVIDGVNSITPINAGFKVDRGAQIDLSTPILARVKLNASINLFNQRLQINEPDGPSDYESFRFATNTTLEWNGRDRGKTPGDVAQLQFMYHSPSRDFEFYRHDWTWLSLSYTHSFRRDLSLSGTISGTGRSRHQLLAPLVEEEYSQRRPLELRLKLLKILGTP